MAFQNVNGSGNLRQLQIGDEITGYVTGFTESTKYPGLMNVDFVTEDGEEVTVAGGGNLKYMIKEDKIQLNVLTKITRKEDGLIKGKVSKKFIVLQDPDQTMSDKAFAALGATDETTPQRAASVAKAAEAGIANQAKKLANSHSKRG